MLFKLGNYRPKIGERVFIADTARVIGNIELDDDVSIWYGVVLRGDVLKIKIGKGSNVQEGTTIHGEPGSNVVFGENVTIGHNCIIHGCKIGDNSVIGMGTTILNGSVIPKNSLVGANSLVTPSLKAEEGMLILGSPARSMKKLSKEQQEYLKDSAKLYVNEIDVYKNKLERVK